MCQTAYCTECWSEIGQICMVCQHQYGVSIHIEKYFEYLRDDESDYYE